MGSYSDRAGTAPKRCDIRLNRSVSGPPCSSYCIASHTSRTRQQGLACAASQPRQQIDTRASNRRGLCDAQWELHSGRTYQRLECARLLNVDNLDKSVDQQDLGRSTLACHTSCRLRSSLPSRALPRWCGNPAPRDAGFPDPDDQSGRLDGHQALLLRSFSFAGRGLVPRFLLHRRCAARTFQRSS